MPAGKKILIIDDELSIRRFLRIALDSDGSTVIEASDAKEGLYKAANERPDLVLLDLGLPDMSGIEVLRKIREWSEMPVIVLTVQDSEDDKITALDGGANDYVTKPFATGELLARIRAALRHTSSEPGDHVFKNGYLTLDTLSHTVESDGREVKLTATEFDLLLLFMKNEGRVLTHRHIMKEIWGPYRLDETHYVRIYVGQLRKKVELSENLPKLLVTEPGVGYRMVVLEQK
jgi:two-component system KDP operon response regulator KdpE